MRHGIVSRRLGVKTGHRTAMLRNLVKGLVRDGSIRTTTARAKVLRSYLEKLVTKLKDPTVANIRYAVSVLNDKESVQALATKIAPVFKNRAGGYLRILRLSGARPGDCADMSIIQWVDEGLVEAGFEARYPKAGVKAEKTSKKGAAKKATKKTSKDDEEGGAESAEKTKKTSAKASKPAKKAKKS